MQNINVISLSLLQEEKYASILCYPKYDPREAMKRIKQLEKLGVTAVHFIGGKQAFGLSVLGKGHVGIVVIADTKTGRAALKIRRLDADRKGMHHEAEMLTKANTLGIGPRLMGNEDDFLLMEFVDGLLLPDWITCLKGRNVRKRIRDVLHDILEQCYRLDQAGLDHGELSRAPKHIIVDALDRPCIVDFETASVTRRTSNVTSMVQYLFMKSQLAKIIHRKLGRIDQEMLLARLRNYKQRSTRPNFDAVLETCKLIQ